MEIYELRAKAADLFPLSTRAAIERPGATNSALTELKALCASNYRDLGFACLADCFDEVAPKLHGELSCIAHCFADLEISGWQVGVKFRPLHLSNDHAHFELRHRGPLPGVTTTGYRSIFLPMMTFQEVTPLQFLQGVIPKAPTAQQMMLF